MELRNTTYIMGTFPSKYSEQQFNSYIAAASADGWEIAHYSTAVDQIRTVVWFTALSDEGLKDDRPHSTVVRGADDVIPAPKHSPSCTSQLQYRISVMFMLQ